MSSYTVNIPDDVQVELLDGRVHAKGKLGEGTMAINPQVLCTKAGQTLDLAAQIADKQSLAILGTMNSLLNNLILGVSQGFEKRLELVGVGYRAQVKGQTLNLQLGYSHPIDYATPDGINIETPTQTEVVVKGTDKQKVGQVAAEIRSYRPPEPYKGKGVKYADERIIRKEAKKK